MLNLIRLTITRARKERLPQVAGSLTFTTFWRENKFIQAPQ